MLTGLRLRMTAITAGAMLVVIAVLAVGVLGVSRSVFTAEVQDRLSTASAEMAHEYGERGLAAIPDRTHYESGIYYMIWTPDGVLAVHPDGVDASPFEPLAHAALDGSVHVSTLHVRSDDILVDSRLSRDQFGRIRGIVQAFTSLESVTAVENRMLTVVGLAGGAALLVGALAAWLVAGRAAGPIEAALRRQRQFTADASHELRTPLTIIDASLQVLRRHPAQTVEESADVVAGAEREVGRMARLVEDMLTLARADAGGLPSQPEPTDVDALVRELVADASIRRDAGEHPLVIGHLGAGVAVVDPAQLRQLLLILVDNAIVHTPDGTPVEVSAGRRGAELVVAVSDQGPGIPPDERERVFERFRRNTAGRPGEGAGLGLAIARELAARAGGTVRLGDNRPGLRAEVALPAGGIAAAADRGWRRWLPLPGSS